MEEAIDHIVCKAMEGYNIPGLSLAVVKDGKTIITKGFGVTDLQTKTKVTEHTQFGIGSITKSFTSTLFASILQHRKE